MTDIQIILIIAAIVLSLGFIAGISALIISQTKDTNINKVTLQNKLATSTSSDVTMITDAYTYQTPLSDTVPFQPEVPLDCFGIDRRYRGDMPVSDWTPDDRIVAIKIINSVYPTLGQIELGKLNNSALQLILRQYCGPISIKTKNCTYNEVTFISDLPYNAWTETNRQSVIWIINNQFPSLSISYLNTLNNAILDRIVRYFCV